MYVHGGLNWCNFYLSNFHSVVIIIKIAAVNMSALCLFVEYIYT